MMQDHFEAPLMEGGTRYVQPKSLIDIYFGENANFEATVGPWQVITKKLGPVEKPAGAIVAGQQINPATKPLLVQMETFLRKAISSFAGGSGDQGASAMLISSLRSRLEEHLERTGSTSLSCDLQGFPGGLRLHMIVAKVIVEDVATGYLGEVAVGVGSALAFMETQFAVNDLNPVKH